MGVPLFFRRIIGNYFSETIKTRKPDRVNTLAIDFIGLPYQLINIYREEKKVWDVELLLENVIAELSLIVQHVAPQDRLIIAIDGIAPLGKMNQQRYRRFRSALEHKGEKVDFDTNQISPGTEFSFRLAEKITKFTNVYANLLPTEVIVSGHLVPGEGEHKIMQYIREFCSPTENVLIYGLDADLVFLSMKLEPHIFLYRENRFINEKRFEKLRTKMPETMARQRSIVEDNSYFDVKLFKELLKRRRIGINEFIFTSFFLGNDFMPIPAGFNLVSDLAESFLNILVDKRFINETLDLSDFEGFMSTLKSLDQLQRELIPKLSGKFQLKNPNDILRYPSPLPTDDFEAFRQAWNDRLTFNKLIPSDEIEIVEGKELHFPPSSDDLNQRVVEYLTTAFWCLKYYQNHLEVDWEHVYYPHWAPLFSDLLGVDRDQLLYQINKVRRTKLLPFGVQWQLLLILPRNLRKGTSNEILPVELRDFQTRTSPIFDFYPLNFNIIREGVFHPTEGVVYIPPFDYKRFLNFSNAFPPLLSTKFNEKFTNQEPIIRKNPKPEIRSIILNEESLTKIIELPKELSNINDLQQKKISQVMGYGVENMISGKTTRLFPEINAVPMANEKLTLIKTLIRGS